MSKMPQRVVLVTGPSGAGRSTAINALEDAGFEAVDNIPLSFVPRLTDSAAPATERPLAVGIDARNREFSTTRLVDLIGTQRARPDLKVTVLYLDCAPDVLQRRFSETRRRHPMAASEDPMTGIALEMDLLSQVRDLADVVIDTTSLTVHDTRAAIRAWFAKGSAAQGLSVVLHSFSYKRGLPPGLDMVFDVRFLRNPYWVPELRGLTGQDQAVQDHVMADARFAPFFDRVSDMTRFLLPAYGEEGKSHLSIGFGCTGGQHRSVTLAERLASVLAEEDVQVSIRHHEMERKTAARGT